MPPRKTTATPTFTEVRTTTAPCVPRIREKVLAWRNAGYPGTSETTRTLLNYWFHTSHRLGRTKFKYHLAQEEAVETIIYLFEVANIRSVTALIEKFAERQDLKLLQNDIFTRYCTKMATGSGKTKVMSLVMAWQFFNSVVELNADYARTFLVIAPNVIVFERLRSDFEGGFVFRTDPVIPPELKTYWEMNYYVRGDAERTSSPGAVYLTNIQQIYPREEKPSDEPDVMTAMLGRKPNPKLQVPDDFIKRIVERGDKVAVFNDEAHHTHDEDSAWNKSIRTLHEQQPLAAQFDFSATPRHTKGQLFSWIVSDYSLKQAIHDGIVKRPIKGVTKGIGEAPSNIASQRYQAYLTAAVERWKEYVEALSPLKRKPLLFVMMHETKDADDVGGWLQDRYPQEFGGEKTLVIHTDRQGEVSKADVDKLRTAARDVDKGVSPVSAIVSVMMLREGWDVQGVTVIVGLRPYAAKANILPEQTVGRGLRLMFRDAGHGYTERVDILGNKGFLQFVEALEKDEEFQLDEEDLSKVKVRIETIMIDPKKMVMDIALPELSPILVRKSSLEQEIAALKIPRPAKPLPMKESGKEAEEFRYEGHDLIEMKKLFERDYTIPTPQTAEEVIGFYARRIAQDVKLPSQFAMLVPKVREFLAEKAFHRTVDLSTPEMIRAIAGGAVGYVTVQSFVKELRKLVVEEREPQLTNTGRKLSETPGFPWSRPVLDKAKKCIFNKVPCDNLFELAFAKFLQNADDIERFSKLPEQFGFIIAYTDTMGNMRHYEPDFVAVDTDGVHYLLETKGLEDINVANKDRAAALWAENATALTGTVWHYLKVLETKFKSLQPDTLSDLLATE